MARLLIVDDDPDVCVMLRGILEDDGFHVSEAGSRSAALAQLISDSTIRLVTLDLGLGNDNGLKVAREMQAIRAVPIVMISGRGDRADRIAGFESGADDYIVKPFEAREAILRIRNVMRRYGLLDGGCAPPPLRTTRLAFATGMLNPERRELRSVAGAKIDLTETEFHLLAFFLANSGRVLSRDEIMQRLKGHDWSPLDRSIDGHVARLRRKIEPTGGAPTLIKSVRGIGYVFAGEVTLQREVPTPNRLRDARTGHGSRPRRPRS